MARKFKITTRYILILLTLATSACTSTTGEQQTAQINPEPTDTFVTITVDSIDERTEATDSIYSDYTDYATFYVIVADTNTDYYLLRNKMFQISEQLNLPIDTMGRHFNDSTKIIALPDDDDDELYAGSYYPRRFPSDHLSLEYLWYYENEVAGENTIALVTGIYESEKSADSALAALKKVEQSGFKIKADSIFVGCMR